MQLLRYLRPSLERLLQISATSEASHREKELKRERNRLVKRLADQDREAKMAVAKLGSTITDLQRTIKQLETFVESRDRRIEGLEHEREVLKQDIKGMTSVNARALKYIECIRTAEERNPDSNNLGQQLQAVQDIATWPIS